ncbi:hypothetical protein HQ487_01005, partial [Candidatus Uhrbacteria bacterium]|nr:hypothetical protein [Candidatus Uhrbacteria bacterium]
MPWFILRLLELKERILSVTKKHSHGKLRTSVIFVFSFFSFFLASPVHAETPSPLAVDGILLFFAEFAFSIAGALMKFIVVLIDAMIPIMTFNRFVDNPVVKNGWAIMRDTVNMFFVIVLIIIAFGTIFGNSRFKWQQQVPRLLIFAIVINFSKTICGIMIDFGQVIMLTFANALKEVAAGNFIKTLGLDKIYSVSVNQSAIKDLGSASAANPNQSFDFFAAGVMSVVLIMWVLATLIILVAILLYRIIMLWVLVVMAPLAWFMGGVAGKDGVFSSNAYADWWNEFKCMVAVGPVLVFFLWLTLVVAGSGNIAAEANFDVPAASNNASFASSLLELNHFLSFIIAMAMLMAGFKAATQMCSAVQGKFIGQALGAGQSGALVKSAIGFSAKGGSLGLRAGAKGAVAGYGLAGSGMRKIAPSGLVNAPGNLGRYVKGGAAGVGAKVFGNSAAGQYFKGKQMDTQ